MGPFAVERDAEKGLRAHLATPPKKNGAGGLALPRSSTLPMRALLDARDERRDVAFGHRDLATTETLVGCGEVLVLADVPHDDRGMAVVRTGSPIISAQSVISLFVVKMIEFVS